MCFDFVPIDYCLQTIAAWSGLRCPRDASHLETPGELVGRKPTNPLGPRVPTAEALRPLLTLLLQARGYAEKTVSELSQCHSGAVVTHNDPAALWIIEPFTKDGYLSSVRIV